MQDIVSVITTFYNDENYILKCINSVNCQLVNNQFKIEYILVNDCSEDSSQEIVNIYFNKKSNENVTIKIIKHKTIYFKTSKMTTNVTNITV